MKYSPRQICILTPDVVVHILRTQLLAVHEVYRYGILNFWHQYLELMLYHAMQNPVFFVL